MFRILFFGTSDFAVPSLEALAHDGRFSIAGVITQPDRPVGRHGKIEAGIVKQSAQKNNLSSIWQPEKLSDEAFSGWIREIGPSSDVFVIVSYGKILPAWLLALPKKGIINVHSSLLPRWRGASPVQSTIAAGDELTGVSVMKIDDQMDHGPLLAQIEEPVLPSDTAETLYHRLFEIGGKALPNILADYLNDQIELTEQDHSLATYCKILTREDGKIDWLKPAIEIERLIRAHHPWPGTWTEVEGKRLKIISAKLAPSHPDQAPGELFVEDKQLFMNCGERTTLELLQVQPEGKKSMRGEEYGRGRNTTTTSS